MFKFIFNLVMLALLTGGTALVFHTCSNLVQEGFVIAIFRASAFGLLVALLWVIALILWDRGRE